MGVAESSGAHNTDTENDMYNRPGLFPARFAGRCICGGGVKVGDRIAYDHTARQVVACHKCLPPRKRGKIGPRIQVRVRGGNLTVASVRHRETGRVFALSFRWAACDCSQDWCDYRPTGPNGEWVLGNRGGLECPDHLTHQDVVEAIRQAAQKTQVKKAA